MVRNNTRKGNVVEFSKLYSDGSYYTYQINKNKIMRTSVILAFDEGIVEPVEKIIYPDISFKKKRMESNGTTFFGKRISATTP